MAENRSLAPTVVTAVLAFVAGWVVLQLVLRVVNMAVTILILIGLVAVIAWIFDRRRN